MLCFYTPSAHPASPSWAPWFPWRCVVRGVWVGVWAAGRNPPACSMYPLGTCAPAYTRTHVHARALHRPGYSLTPSVNLQASIAASLSLSFCLLLSFLYDKYIYLKINYKKCTCHHACDGRGGVSRLCRGGDVRWVARQGGAHHVPPCKRKLKMTQVLLTVRLFLNELCKKECR